MNSLSPLGLYRLTRLPLSRVNVRAAPDVNSADLGDLYRNDVVLMLGISAGWYNVEYAGVRGYVSRQGGAVEFQSVEQEQWTYRLPVPYVSQTSSTASKSNNDCGVASLLMQIRYWMRRHDLLVPGIPTVDMLIPYTRLGQTPPPHGLTFAELDTLAGQLGYKTTYRQPMNMGDIAAALYNDTELSPLGLDFLPHMPYT